MTSIIPQDNQKPLALIGIYRITCTANGKIYIGQSKRLLKRINEHRSLLLHRRHTNLHMQGTWNKYGETSFVFDIIEICEYAVLTEREQYWLDTLQPFNAKGFNHMRIAEAPPSSKGVKRSLETRARLSAASKGRTKTPEQCKQMSEARKGISRGPNTPEHCKNISIGTKGVKKLPAQVEKMAETKRKGYIVVSPEGQEFLIKGIRKFCESHNLHNAAMIKVAQGVQKAHKGWKCRYA